MMSHVDWKTAEVCLVDNRDMEGRSFLNHWYRYDAEHDMTVKTVELKFGVPRGQCRFENVQARRDGTGQKVWFVQRNTSRIVATLDLETHETTGPDDEPPSWAIPDGGEPLASATE